jgi:hypothetical protein
VRFFALRTDPDVFIERSDVDDAHLTAASGSAFLDIL